MCYDGCGLSANDGIKVRTCRQMEPTDRELWCWSCIAKATLEEYPGAKEGSG